MKYRKYQVEDFVADLDFIRWVTNPNEDDKQFWSQWIAENPGKKNMIEEARLIVLTLKHAANNPEFSQQQLNNSKLNVLHAIRQRKGYSILPWAAAIIMAITASFLFFWILTEDGEVKYKTAYAETMQLSLPDGSTVVLNANSKLKFIDNWHKTIEREIWLDGEAFFEVQEKTYNQKPSKFIIHTTSGIEVTVLGTSFNVNDRKYKAEVVLNSGKVKLTSPQFNQDLFMIPGDMVSYQSETGKIEKKKVDPAQYAEWTNQQLNFTDEPLNEIIDRVETLFGLQIRFENFNPKGKRFTGATPYQDVEILLLTIAKAYGLTYEKNGNSIQLNKK